MVNKLYLVTPRGFCAGVEMAIKALHWLIKIYDDTIYCYHEIVHNKWIVKEFEKNNVIFVEDPSEIPEGSIVMLSAHGTAPDIEKQFNNISAVTINSVCPLVTKVHHEAKIFSKNNTQIIYVGHKNHDEAKGALGVASNNMHLVEKIEDVENLNIGDDVALLAQTTLAKSEWEPIMEYSQNKYNKLKMPRKSDLCYATTNRQEAILEILPKVDSVLVVGSENSSNTKALVSMVQNKGITAYRVDNVKDLDGISLNGNIAITAGASAPDHIVYEIIDNINPINLEYFKLKEEVEYFPLPQQLRKNIRLISNFLNNFNESVSKPGAKLGINNDKEWTATEALNSL
ncbi:MAG: 4-hydroxy-3-methylbut-2-enyl diphosphate reductase [Actinobacteria bacterium]|nr:4-hydroxy-3-methylbut-2-enyl diphosphate reductase [Actinomycetota bacterium]